jgi:hypothetical protein
MLRCKQLRAGLHTSARVPRPPHPHAQAAAEVLCACLLRDPALLAAFLSSPDGAGLLLRLLRCRDAGAAFCAAVVLATGRAASSSSAAAGAPPAPSGEAPERVPLARLPLPLLLQAAGALAERLTALLQPAWMAGAPAADENAGGSAAEHAAEGLEGEEARLAWLDYGSLAYWAMADAAAGHEDAGSTLGCLQQAGGLLEAAAAAGAAGAGDSGGLATPICCLAGAVCCVAGCTPALERSAMQAADAAQRRAESEASAAAAAAAEAARLAAEASSSAASLTPFASARRSSAASCRSAAAATTAAAAKLAPAPLDVGAVREAAVDAALLAAAGPALRGLRGTLALRAAPDGSDADEVRGAGVTTSQEARRLS